jgi:hypothetical protein
MSHILITEPNQEPYYELSLINNKKCKIDVNSLSKIMHVNHDSLNFIPNWFLHNTGYIVCSIPSNQILNYKRTFYMHRYLLNQYNYDGRISVDHINQDPTDNRLSNLRLSTQSTQNHNQRKKERNFIKLSGFDTDIQLPEYIELVKEETIKTTRNGKEYTSILPEHFRIVSKYLNFEKHSTKSSKISLKERLSDALIKRYNLIVNSYVNIKDLCIDGYRFTTIDEFENHTLEYIKILCNITIDKITDDDDFLENSKIKKVNIPKYVSYSPPKKGRGSQLTYDRRNKETNERTEFSSSSSKFKSLDDKFIKIVELMKKNQVEIIWDVKPDFINELNEIQSITNDHNFSKECLMEIKNSCMNKTPRLKPNPLDIIIITKLNNDIENINKSIVTSVMQINYDRVSQIINNQLKLDTMNKISEDYLKHTNLDFIEEYNIIKNMILTEMTSRKDKKSTSKQVKKTLPCEQDLLDLTSKLSNTLPTTTITKQQSILNNQKPKYNWKFDIDTIIDMVKDKGVLTYQEISKKYTDIEDNMISISDVQNVCTNSRAYSLDESDFLNRSDMSFEEYKSKRQSDVRLDMTHKTMDQKYSDISSNQYKELCKTNSISKRTCTSITLVQIFKDKYSILTAQKTALKYKNKMDETVSECLVKQIWSGSSQLFKDDFINQTDITYQQYLEDVKKEKTEFSRPLEYKKKFDEIIDGIDKKTIKELNRTHIKTLKMVGKDDIFINNLRKQIKTL